MLEALKKSVFHANIELVQRGLVIYTWGNASGIDRDSGLVVIKPSGVDYDDLKPSDLSVVDLDGKHVEGLKPSSDTPTHLALYKSWEDLGGVVHTHSKYATIFSQAIQSIPCLGTTHADYFNGPVPCLPPLSSKDIQGDYEANTGIRIVEHINSLGLGNLSLTMPAILIGSHGPFTWGKCPNDAVHNAVVLEEIALMAWHTIMLNPKIQPISSELLQKHYQRKHGDSAYYGQ